MPHSVSVTYKSSVKKMSGYYIQPKTPSTSFKTSSRRIIFHWSFLRWAAKVPSQEHLKNVESSAGATLDQSWGWLARAIPSRGNYVLTDRFEKPQVQVHALTADDLHQMLLFANTAVLTVNKLDAAHPQGTTLNKC